MIWTSAFFPFERVMQMTIPQLDSAIDTCRRVEAERVITQTRANFFAAQADGKELEKFLKSWKEALQAEDPNDGLKRALQIFAKFRQ